MKKIDKHQQNSYNININGGIVLIFFRRYYIMKINYKKLWILLIKKDITPVKLRKDLNIATGTMTKLRKN